MSEILSTIPDEKKDDWIALTTDDEVQQPTPTNEASSSVNTSSETMMEAESSPIETSEVEDPILPVSTSSAKDINDEVAVIQELDDVVVVQPESATQQDPLFVQIIRKGLDENVKKLQGVVDEHVKPHLVNAKTAVDENLEKHVHPHWEKAAKKWKTLSLSTKALMDEKVKPGLEGFKKGTVEGFENVKKGTVEGLETVKNGTVQGFETSKRALIDLPVNSKRAIDEHVLPVVESVKVGTKTTLDQISTKSVESYQMHVLPHIVKAHQVHTTYESCYMGRATGLFANDESRPHYVLAEACLRSYGMVVFCDNPVTGGVIWLAMLISVPSIAISSFASVISLTYCAKFLQVTTDDELRRGGIGVNAVLVGAGASAFLDFEDPLLGWLGSLVLATFFLPPITLMVYLHCQRSSLFKGTEESPSIPTLLVPYNIVILAFLITALFWDRSLIAVAEIEESEVERNLFIGIFNGLSKIFLVEGALSGVLILGGTLLCSRILAGSLLTGSIIATLLGWSFGLPAIALNAGVAGYNAALTTAAMAYFFEPSWILVVVGLFVVVLSGLFQAAFALLFWDALGLPVTLTLGFCIATVAILVMDKEESCSQVGVLKRIKENELTTPEEFLASRTHGLVDVPDDLILVDDEEEGVANYSGGEKKMPSELTPLIAK